VSDALVHGVIKICYLNDGEFLEQVSYLLTELSPSWEATNCAATRALPSVLWNPKAHYRVHKSPPLVSILSQIDPVHTISSYLSKIYFNGVHPPTSWSSWWSLSLRLSHQYPRCIPLIPHSCYMLCPPPPPWFDTSSATVPSEPALYVFLTFEVPNRMSIFLSTWLLYSQKGLSPWT
jgi:hypothetical protein